MYVPAWVVAPLEARVPSARNTSTLTPATGRFVTSSRTVPLIIPPTRREKFTPGVVPKAVTGIGVPDVTGTAQFAGNVVVELVECQIRNRSDIVRSG